ncbi:hypothetical protein [Desulfolucanica intricata]|uniref:hypothetical protein n=1 Tax=Desulfolucanica intricata TaxID=1285191 RepID=UPI000A6BAD8C|nr:hypothetical protein [Desulfolucanica intricata]
MYGFGPPPPAKGPFGKKKKKGPGFGPGYGPGGKNKPGAGPGWGPWCSPKKDKK